MQVATRFIIAKLRNQQFFSLSALNVAIAELVAQSSRLTRMLVKVDLLVLVDWGPDRLRPASG